MSEEKTTTKKIETDSGIEIKRVYPASAWIATSIALYAILICLNFLMGNVEQMLRHSYSNKETAWILVTYQAAIIGVYLFVHRSFLKKHQTNHWIWIVFYYFFFGLCGVVILLCSLLTALTLEDSYTYFHFG